MIFNYNTVQEETNQVLYNINMKMNLEEFKIFSSIMNNLALEDLYKVTLIKQQVEGTIFEQDFKLFSSNTNWNQLEIDNELESLNDPSRKKQVLNFYKRFREIKQFTFKNPED